MSIKQSLLAALLLIARALAASAPKSQDDLHCSPWLSNGRFDLFGVVEKILEREGVIYGLGHVGKHLTITSFFFLRVCP